MTARTARTRTACTTRFGGCTDRLAARMQSRAAFRTADPEAGMTTAEYAVGTVAACGFGGVLYKVVTSQEVMKMIKDLIIQTIKHYFHF